MRRTPFAFEGGTLVAIVTARRHDGGSSFLFGDQPVPQRDEGRLRTIGDAEFPEDGTDVIAECALGQEQAGPAPPRR